MGAAVDWEGGQVTTCTSLPFNRGFRMPIPLRLPSLLAHISVVLSPSRQIQMAESWVRHSVEFVHPALIVSRASRGIARMKNTVSLWDWLTARHLPRQSMNKDGDTSASVQLPVPVGAQRTAPKPAPITLLDVAPVAFGGRCLRPSVIGASSRTKAGLSCLDTLGAPKERSAAPFTGARNGTLRVHLDSPPGVAPRAVVEDSAGAFAYLNFTTLHISNLGAAGAGRRGDGMEATVGQSR